MCSPYNPDYNPDKRSFVGNAMGRNKLIYAMADLTLVVACEPDKGGTWLGATEALEKKFGRVAVWQGPGEGTGNAQLVEKGATPISSIDKLESIVLRSSDWDALGSTDSVASDAPKTFAKTATAKEQLLPFESVV